MELRKEQVLLLATVVVLGGLLALGAGKEINSAIRKPSSKKLEDVSFPQSSIVEGQATKLDRGARDLFLKPSATKPLPPLDLQLPKLQPLPVLLPLLEAGPSLAKLHGQRVRLDELPVQVASTGGQGNPTAPAGGQATAANGQPPVETEEADYSDEYDRISLNNGRQLWGQVRGDDPFGYGNPEEQNLWALVGPFKRPVVFQRYRPEKGTAGITDPWPPENVLRVEFARRIDNKIALMRRRIPTDGTGLAMRRDFVIDLLENHRDSEIALQEAEAQARKHVELAPNDVDGYELLAYVFHATGQYEKELEFYEGLANRPEVMDAPFIHAGRAMVAHKLGMRALAHAELTRATEQDPSYSRAWLLRARLALESGDSATAVAHAQRAANSRVAGLAPRVSIEIDRVFVLALIADAQFDKASTHLAELESQLPEPKPALLSALRRMRGAIELGLGKFAEAKASFEEAATAMPSDAEASLGACVASMRLGDRAAAEAHAKAAGERDPLLRGRALAAQALVLELQGSRAEALARLSEAREMAPQGRYVLYLLGRLLRGAGEVGESREVLQKLLERRSDFLEAMAERALATARLARNEARNDPAGALLLLGEAERFAARVARDEEDRGKDPVYLDLLGTIRYYQLDNEGAKQAFQKSLAWKPGPYAKIMLALIAYRQGYTSKAINDLVTIPLEIRDPNSPYQQYAESARAAIVDHRGKRLFTDEFERDLGEVWQTESRHQAKWVSANGRVQIRGSSEGDQRQAHCRYTVDQARNFLEVSCKITVLESNTARKSILRLSELGSSNLTGNKSRVLLEVGYDRTKGGAFVYFHQNQGRSKKDRSELAQGDEGFPADLQVRLGQPFEVVVRRIGAQRRNQPGASNKETLVVLIDGREVLRREISEAFGLRQSPLTIDFHVMGFETERLDTAFDDFRLIRYGEG